ncbi:MAG TPA: type II secretion system protein N [Candidatus Binataceae bacterium]|nr:type II secretion system protein N [Candidatus Binataceae bacterium]
MRIGAPAVREGMELHLSDRHIVALNLLLVTVLAYFAALALNDVMLIGYSPSDAPVISVHAKATDDSVSRPRADYQAIVERDIFNIEAPPPPPAPIVEEDLHLTLVGVSTATKGKPYAIVSDARGEQSVYRVGEVIPDSGKLLEVDKDRAIVEHNGKQVVLELPKDDTTGGGDVSPADAAAGDLMRHRRMRRHFE